MPIYQTATFAHPALGQSTGFDYSRSANPTRAALESVLASLDGGDRAFAFSSGLAAIDTVLRLFAPGDRLVVAEDLYGGTFRLLERVFKTAGLLATYVDPTDLDAVQRALSGAAGLFVEIPSNPLLRVVDLAALSTLARHHNARFIVDNTFLTPWLLTPISFGADIVVYSGSKYLAGHNDLVAGVVVTATPELSARVAFLQNAVGAVLGPHDAWLLMRGLKTLHVRLNYQERTAALLAAPLAAHPRVTRVYYPGLPSDPGHALLKRQARGFGAMISFEVSDAAAVPRILESVKVFLFAESLGGVESLITFPAVQTHTDMDPALRERLGINDRLLRLSVGLENSDDLIADLEAVL
jgi:cystathionine gamma-synthase/cystathionine beta-lyase